MAARTGASAALILTRAIAAAIAPAPVAAFGTVEGLGQHAEHRRIALWALSGEGFDALTLREFAGAGGFSFGAIGAADNPSRGLSDFKPAHCDGGDYLDTPGYRQSEADARKDLEACRDWSFDQLARAVADMAPLTKDAAPPTEQPFHCRFDGKRAGSAKCLVLEDLGLALHAAQDFYSHTNWVDAAAPGAISPHNPPGLGHDGPAPWLDPELRAPFPAGLISGCYDGFPETYHCGYGSDQARVQHRDLNKDTGPIDPEAKTVGTGTTPRGAVDGNFRRAVLAAVADTHAKWLYFRRQVIATYGQDAGSLALCHLRKDDPTACAAHRP